MSIEDRVKESPVIWLLATLATGFVAGISTVTWVTSFTKTEVITLADKQEFEKAKSMATDLQTVVSKQALAIEQLEASSKQNQQAATSSKSALEAARKEIEAARLASTGTKDCPKQPARIISDCRVEDLKIAELNEALKQLRAAIETSESQNSSIKSQLFDTQKASVACAERLKSSAIELGACQKARFSAASVPDFLQFQLKVLYKPARTADANRIAQQLAPNFAKITLVECGILDCSTSIRYHTESSPSIGFSLAKLLTNTGVKGFAEPALSASYIGEYRLEVHLQ